jgi:4-methylaminobutanoate oxidase (formaldehyde-forming)
MLWGGELLRRDGVTAGQVTSAAYATTTGACVGLAYVRIAELDGDWQADVGGRLVPITVSTKAPYDPDSVRVKS